MVVELEAQRGTPRNSRTQNSGLVSTATRGTCLYVDVFTYQTGVSVNLLLS